MQFTRNTFIRNVVSLNILRVYYLIVIDLLKTYVYNFLNRIRSCVFACYESKAKGKYLECNKCT